MNEFSLKSIFAGAHENSSKSLVEIQKDHAHETDAQIVAAFLAGNGECFSALVDRHAPMVYRFVYGYLRNADNADDVTQDVFIKVWKNIRSFDQSKNFKTWLLTVAKNTALDFIKKKKPLLFSRIEEAGENDLDVFLAPYVDAAESPSDMMQRKHDRESIADALAELTPSYRTVLTLRYADQLKFREIAELTGESIDTIKSKHRRGLMALKKRFAR